MNANIGKTFSVLFLGLALIAITVAITAQTVSTANETAPLPTVASPLIAYLPYPTATESAIVLLATDTATLLDTTKLPAGTKGFHLIALGNSLNYGNASCSTGLTWPTIASGSKETFYCSPITSKPSMYLCNGTAGTAVSYRVVPFK